MLCRLKPSGSFTIGVGMLVKQKVRLHFSQWKWVWRSFTSHEHDELHTAYLNEPVPSSILWMRWCDRKRVKVRKMLERSTVSSRSSRSANETDCPACIMAFSTSSRIAVGCISLWDSNSKYFFSSIQCLFYQFLYPHGVEHGKQCYPYVGKHRFPQGGHPCRPQCQYRHLYS